MREGVTRIWPCRAAAIAGRAHPEHSRNDHPAKAAFVVVSDLGSEMGADEEAAGSTPATPTEKFQVDGMITKHGGHATDHLLAIRVALAARPAG